MPETVFGNLLQLVRRPMAKIKRASRAELEWVAGSSDVIHVKLGATINQPLHRRRLELPQHPGVALYGLEKLFVANERHLYRFDITRPFIARGKKGQKL